MCIVLAMVLGGIIGYLIGEYLTRKRIKPTYSITLDSTADEGLDNPKEVAGMKITDVSKYVARNQKGKKISVAQISEILRTANRKTKGAIYKAIRGK